MLCFKHLSLDLKKKTDRNGEILSPLEPLPLQIISISDYLGAALTESLFEICTLLSGLS